MLLCLLWEFGAKYLEEIILNVSGFLEQLGGQYEVSDSENYCFSCVVLGGGNIKNKR
jgi:hypothetical protein